MSAHKAPLPYQVDGIRYLAGRHAALLGDDTGLGKSMQMIGAADASGASRVLVLTPAVGRVSWALQFAEWDTCRRLVLNFPDQTAGLIPDGPLALIVTLDYLSNPKRAADFALALSKAEAFDACFIDEAHGLKTPTANRTRAIYGRNLDRQSGILRDALHRGQLRHIWPASATFTPLHAGELYPHLSALFPDVLRGLFKGKAPNYHQFLHRFCNVVKTSFGDKIDGNRKDTIPELRDALRPHLLLRTKAEVLGQLPPLTTDLLPLEVADKGELDAALEPDRELATDLCRADDDVFLDALRTAWSDPHYSTRRKALGELKAKAAVEWIVAFLKADPARKLVIFAHHRAVLDLLSDRLYGARLGKARLDGATSAAEAADAVHRFQHEPACRVFLGQNRAASTAITLTAASTVLMLEPDPSPAINYQAVSRCHRLGQASNVHALFGFEARNPIERRLVNIIRRRASDNLDLFGVDNPATV